MLGFVRSPRLQAALQNALWPFVFLVALQALGAFETLGLRSFDLMNRLRATGAPPPDVVIVGYDREDVRELGLAKIQSDTVTLQLLQRIRAANAKVIGVHLYTSTPRPPGTDALRAFMQSTANVVALDGREIPFLRLPEVYPPDPVLMEANRSATAPTTKDSDMIVRRTFMGWDPKAGTRQSSSQALPAQVMPLLLAQKYLGEKALYSDSQGNLHMHGKRYPPLGTWHGEYAGGDAATPSNLVLLGTRSFSDADTLTYREALDPATDVSKLAGKIVLIGGITADSESEFQLPFQWRVFSNRWEISYRVDVTAHQLDNLIAAARDGWPVFRAWPWWLGVCWLAFWMLLGAYWLVPTRGFGEWFGIACTLLTGLYGAALLGFYTGWMIPTAAPMLGIVSMVIYTVAYVFRTERSLRGFVEVTRRVLNQLPEPIFVKDSLGNFRLVNESFCRLADALPAELIGKSVSDSLPAWQSSALALAQPFGPDSMDASNRRADGNVQQKTMVEDQFVDARGRRYSVAMVVSRLPRPGRQDLVFGLMRSFIAVGQEHAKPADFDQLHGSYERCEYWAKKHGQTTLVQLIEVEDFALLIDAYGQAATDAILPIVRERLMHAFPQAYALSSDPSPGRFWVLRHSLFNDHHTDATQRALEEVFAYDFAIGGESVRLNARCASASAPLDGESFAELHSAVLKQLQQ